MRIFITDTVDADTCNRHVRDILASNDRNVYLYLDSEGGDPDAAIYFASFLRSCHRNVITVVTGSCMSATMVVFMAGNERWAIDSANFMMHPASDVYEKDTSLNQYEMEDLLQDAKACDEKIYRASIVGSSLNLKMVIKKVVAAPGYEWTFSAKEALSYGIATSIGTPFETPGTMLDPTPAKGIP